MAPNPPKWAADGQFPEVEVTPVAPNPPRGAAGRLLGRCSVRINAGLASGRQAGGSGKGARKAGPLGTKMLLKSRGPEPVFRTWRSRDGRLLCTRRASLDRQLGFCKRVAVECKVDKIATLHSTSCPPAKPLIAHRRPMSSANYFPHVRDECRCGGAGTAILQIHAKSEKVKGTRRAARRSAKQGHSGIGQPKRRRKAQTL